MATAVATGAPRDSPSLMFTIENQNIRPGKAVPESSVRRPGPGQGENGYVLALGTPKQIGVFGWVGVDYTL